jgi:hypothetical protein
MITITERDINNLCFLIQIQAAKLINSIGLEKFPALTCNTATFSILLFDNLLSNGHSVFT